MKRVLIVDDSRGLLRVFSIALTNMGYEVETAPDGVAALLAIPEYQPHVVLLDIGLPGVDGLEVCRQIKSDPSGDEISIIMFSAHSTKENVLEAHQAGASGFLVKGDVAVADICRAIEQHS
ncbi:MAG: response regulator [Planctomycetota bacterium]|jgi:CheY-like chemotaxis protein|nr:response regulator [Planctomycetota bacterium]